MVNVAVSLNKDFLNFHLIWQLCDPYWSYQDTNTQNYMRTQNERTNTLASSPTSNSYSSC